MKKPKNYYCHRTTAHPDNLPEQYEVIGKIGEGAFGQVFKIFNTNTSKIEVMKKIKGEDNTGLRQTEVLATMTQSDGFAKFRETVNKQEVIIMELLGISLEEVMKRSLDVVDLKRIGHQCLLRLKQLHERGYVHRDVKPQNILLGNRNNPHKVYIVDFGLASSYKKKSLVARKCYQGEIGTIKFCPVASHLGLEQFPKEDLESLGYVLVFVMLRSLPWNAVPKGLNQKEKFDAIRKIKQQVEIEKLCGGLGCLKKYFKYVRQLKVGDPINYNKLLEVFYVPCEDHYCYSFCEKDCYSKQKGQGDKENDGELQEKIENARIPNSGFISSRQNRL